MSLTRAITPLMVLKLLDKFKVAGTIGGSTGSKVDVVEISMSVSEFFM